MTHPPGPPTDPGGGDGTTGPGREYSVHTQIVAILQEAEHRMASSFAAADLGDHEAADEWLDRAYATLQDHLDRDQLVSAVVLLLARYADRRAARLLSIPDAPVRSRRRKPRGPWSFTRQRT